METVLEAKASTYINAPASRVWRALVDPEEIKEYFFGSEVISDWRKGGKIIFRGEWEGKAYEDKGIIQEIIPEKTLHYLYWSNWFEKEDKEENYLNVKYELTPEGHGTRLTITQDAENEQKKEHSENNWQSMLEVLKKRLEKEYV